MRFVSKYLTELGRLIGIKQNPSTTYHPQTDGRTERMNQMIEQYLWIFINYHQDDWKDWLSITEFTYNDSPHTAHQQTPFVLNYGQHPWRGDDMRREVRNKATGDFMTEIKREEKRPRLHCDKRTKE